MQEYKTVIKPKRAWFDLNLKELFRYRDLIMLFVLIHVMLAM